MKTLGDFLRDMLLALMLGLLIGLGLLLVFGILGLIFGGLQGALEASRSSVLLCGGFLMLFSAVLMLKGGNLPADAFALQPWKKQQKEDPDDVEPLHLFRKLPGKYGYLLIAAGILTSSILPESVILYWL